MQCKISISQINIHLPLRRCKFDPLAALIHRFELKFLEAVQELLPLGNKALSDKLLLGSPACSLGPQHVSLNLWICWSPRCWGAQSAFVRDSPGVHEALR